MGRSLKEALLDQYALLQERGLAPTEVPQEEDAPLVVVESAPRGRAARPRRESAERYLESDDLDANGQFDRDRRRPPRREHRGEEPRERRRGGRGRGRAAPREAEAEFALAGPAGPSLERGAPRSPRPSGPVGGGPRPPRPGGPRPGGPPGGPGRPPSRTQMLQQRAEMRRRDEEDINEMRRLLAEYGGREMDDAAMQAFSQAMEQETGALPPPHVVVAAIKEAQTADPRKIGDAVRAYYRRPRPRPPVPQPPVGAPA